MRTIKLYYTLLYSAWLYSTLFLGFSVLLSPLLSLCVEKKFLMVKKKFSIKSFKRLKKIFEKRFQKWF